MINEIIASKALKNIPYLLGYVAGEISKLAQEGRDSISVNERLEKELLQMKKDLQVAQESERRQTEIIQSQRLKQERSDSELIQQRHVSLALVLQAVFISKTIRHRIAHCCRRIHLSVQMYERLQNDLASLYSSLESSREMLVAQHEAIEKER